MTLAHTKTIHQMLRAKRKKNTKKSSRMFQKCHKSRASRMSAKSIRTKFWKMLWCEHHTIQKSTMTTSFIFFIIFISLTFPLLFDCVKMEINEGGIEKFSFNKHHKYFFSVLFLKHIHSLHIHIHTVNCKASNKRRIESKLCPKGRKWKWGASRAPRAYTAKT